MTISLLTSLWEKYFLKQQFFDKLTMKQMREIILFLLCMPILLSAQTNVAEPILYSNYLNNMIFVDGSYKRNLGEFGEVWENAVCVNVSYGYRISKKLLLTLGTGLESFNLKDDLSYDDASFKLIPVHIGGKYIFKYERIQPYLVFVSGFNIIIENVNLDGTKKDDTSIKYHWQVGTGSIIMINNRIGIDLSINYQNSFYEKEAMMTGIKYKFGFLYQLSN